MSNLESTDSCLTFDDILEAVQESKRGRWFLREFESRIQTRESQGLLQAIQRLERRMESLTASINTPAELDKLRSAIGSARTDLKRLASGNAALSAEGRLFADLAEMARKSLPANDDSKDKIVRSLQLVDEIDRAMEGLTNSGTRYFMADAQVFENNAASVPKPVDADASPRGATLVVRHVDAGELRHETADDEAPSRPSESAGEAKVNHPRITIIRRSADEMPEVAVPEPQASVSAA
jgi:hypothetical protein